MNSTVINFELFRNDSEEIYNTLKEEIDVVLQQGQTSIIGLMLADGFLNKHNDLYNKIIDYANSIGVDVKIILGMSYDNKLNCKVIKFNFNLHTVWNSYKDADLLPYNYKTNKFLFLGGVPDRLNRIGLLYELYKQDLLKHAEWSFFAPWTKEQEETSKKYFSNQEDYVSFINYAERSIDSVYNNSKKYGTGDLLCATEWTHSSSWIDPEIFSKTSLSIISEGHPAEERNSKFLTEKTYRAFVQGHPFLFAGNISMFKYIKELGFKTFENYFPHPDYATLPTEYERLAKLIENLKYFVNNKIDFTADVEYNRQHFFKLANDNNKILNTLDIDKNDINHYFDRKGFGHLI